MAISETPGASHGAITRWWNAEKAAGKRPEPWEVGNMYGDELTALGQQQTSGFAAENARRDKEKVLGSNTQMFARDPEENFLGRSLYEQRTEPSPAGQTGTALSGMDDTLLAAMNAAISASGLPTSTNPEPQIPTGGPGPQVSSVMDAMMKAVMEEYQRQQGNSGE